MGVKKLTATLIACVLAASLAACAKEQHQGATGGAVTFVQPQSFDSLYPPASGFYANGGIVGNLADRLLFQDPQTLGVYPWLATALPEVNDNATEYTFKLRKDVTYSDGSALDADNVVKNFMLYAAGDAGRNLQANPLLRTLTTAEAVDAYTVRFYFSSPTPDFAETVASPDCGLIANSTLDGGADDFTPGHATAVIGSGPFVVADEKPGSEITLTAREDYNWAPPVREHQGRAAIDTVHVRANPDDSERLDEVERGTIDMSGHIEPADEARSESKKIHLTHGHTNGIANSLVLRIGHPILQDKRVRQAIIAGVDREALKKDIFTDSYPVASSILERGAPGYVEQKNAFAFNRDRANTLLDQAGWHLGEDGVREKQGRRLELAVNDAAPLPESKQVVAALQQQLKEIGVVINFYPGDFADQVEAAQDQQSIQLLHIAERGPHVGLLSSEFSISGRDAARNAQPDGTLADAVLEDIASRTPADPQEMQAHLAREAYVLPLVEQPIVYGSRKGIRGFSVDASGLPSFYEVYRTTG